MAVLKPPQGGQSKIGSTAISGNQRLYPHAIAKYQNLRANFSMELFGIIPQAPFVELLRNFGIILYN